MVVTQSLQKQNNTRVGCLMADSVSSLNCGKGSAWPLIAWGALHRKLLNVQLSLFVVRPRPIKLSCNHKPQHQETDTRNWGNVLDYLLLLKWPRSQILANAAPLEDNTRDNNGPRLHFKAPSGPESVPINILSNAKYLLIFFPQSCSDSPGTFNGGKHQVITEQARFLSLWGMKDCITAKYPKTQGI